MAIDTCLFLIFRPRDAGLSAEKLAEVIALVKDLPKLSKAIIHTASAASDPYVKDGAPPQLVLQLYFGTLSDLEAATSHDTLQSLASRDRFPALAVADIEQQVMLVRSFSVSEPNVAIAKGTPHCTYLVAYEGEAQDIGAWLHHYLDKHTAHMARFPGLRELEVYTRLDAASALPWRRSNCMQRNKVVFDSAEALTQALNSPVRHEMRADFNAFPPFTGPTTHYAMATRVVQP
jgi:uncharacterized protein (TIGR02118 family)